VATDKTRISVLGQNDRHTEYSGDVPKSALMRVLLELGADGTFPSKKLPAKKKQAKKMSPKKRPPAE